MNEDEILSKGVNIINSYQIGSIEGSGYSYNNQYANQYYYVSNVKGLGSFDYGYQGFILHSTYGTPENASPETRLIGNQVKRLTNNEYNITGSHILNNINASYNNYKKVIKVYEERDINITSGLRYGSGSSSHHDVGLAIDYQMKMDKNKASKWVNKIDEVGFKLEETQEIFLESMGKTYGSVVHIASKAQEGGKQLANINKEGKPVGYTKISFGIMSKGYHTGGTTVFARSIGGENIISEIWKNNLVNENKLREGLGLGLNSKINNEYLP